jgi:flagella basal body P-ring formation protein FlgA
MTRLALGLVALFFAAASANASVVSVKPNTAVSGDTVTLGDLFLGVGEAAPQAVAPAPALGRTLVFDAQRLGEIARAHGLAWRPASRLDRAVIERASHVIGHEQIAQATAEALQRAGAGTDRELSFDGRQLRLTVPAGEKVKLEIRDLRFDERSERFTANAIAGAASIAVAGQAARLIEVPAAATRLVRGEIVQGKDLRMHRVRAATLSQDALTTANDIVGKAARRTIAPGEVIRVSDIQTPIAIEKGALVTMIVQTPFMRLTSQGKALEDGAVGETIRVLNVRSKKTVEAQVAKSDTVLVPFIQAQ